jgi:hypothetical protein
MAVALVALFSSLVGGAAAATLITGSDIAKNAIAKKHLKANAVRSGKVKDGSLLSKDFKPGQLVAGAPGPQGLAGAKGDPCLPADPACQGPKGDKGDTGSAGTNGTNGTNGADATKLFATVKSTGALIKGSGVTGVTGTTSPYHVTFNRDVGPDKCAAVATGGTVDGASVFTRIATVVPTGPFGGNANTMDVYLRDTADVLQAGSFHLAVFC